MVGYESIAFGPRANTRKGLIMRNFFFNKNGHKLLSPYVILQEVVFMYSP
jgi:hypothetical protein